MSEIKRIVQATHDDCMRACVATMFGVDLESVPELNRHGWEDVLREWCGAFGYGFVSVTPGGDGTAPSGMVIVAGPSPRGEVDHAVIYLDGKLWHDPHPSGLGVKKVSAIDLFYPLRIVAKEAKT